MLTTVKNVFLNSNVHVTSTIAMLVTEESRPVFMLRFV